MKAIQIINSKVNELNMSAIGLTMIVAVFLLITFLIMKGNILQRKKDEEREEEIRWICAAIVTNGGVVDRCLENEWPDLESAFELHINNSSIEGSYAWSLEDEIDRWQKGSASNLKEVMEAMRSCKEVVVYYEGVRIAYYIANNK